MHKYVKTLIGIAIVIVILAIALRISEGAGGFVKALGIELAVDSSESVNNTAQPVNNTVGSNKKKILEEFKHSFAFKNRACDADADASTQRCVTAGYILDGIVGDVKITKHDRCGSAYVSFEKVTETCGNINVNLKGCGFDSLGDCVSSAVLEGELVLQGYKFE